MSTELGEASKEKAPHPAERAAIGTDDVKVRLSKTCPLLEQVAVTLDSEMSRLEQAVTRSGLTTWTAIVALAGVSWLFLSMFDPSAELGAALVVGIYISAIQDSVFLTREMIQPRQYSLLSRVGYTPVFDAFGASRAYNLIACVRGVGLVVLSSCWLPAGVNLLFPSLFVLLAADAMFQFGISWKADGYFSPVKARGILFWVELVWVVLCFIVSVYYLFWLERMRFGVYDWKVALLCVTALYLVLQLAQPRVEIPVLTRLREIRRDMGFGYLSPEQAVALAERVLVGVSAAGFLLPELEKAQEASLSILERATAQKDRVALLKRGADVNNWNPDELLMCEALGAGVASADRSQRDALRKLKELIRRCQERSEKYLVRTRGDEMLDVGQRAIARLLSFCQSAEDELDRCGREIVLLRQCIVTNGAADDTAKVRMLAICDSIIAVAREPVVPPAPKAWRAFLRRKSK